MDTLTRGDTILLAIAGIAIALALVVRASARARGGEQRGSVMLGRVRVGMRVVAPGGHLGDVAKVRGGLALIRLDCVPGRPDLAPGPLVWADRDRLGRAPERPAGMPLPPPLPGTAELPDPPAILSAGRLARYAAALHDARVAVAWGTVVALVVCMPLAVTVEHSLRSGGFVPDGEAMRVERDLGERFRMPAIEVVAVVPGDARRSVPRMDSARRSILGTSHVVWVSEPEVAPGGDAALVHVGLDSTDEDAMAGATAGIRSSLHAAGLDGAKLAGRPVFAKDIEVQMKKDLATAEIVGLPAALLVLLIVFGTVPSAALPLLVGSVSVWVTLAIVHVVALGTDMSVFVMNIASMLGFGLGIDYSLLGVSRFRDELARGASVRDATIATTCFAGRATIVSGIAVMLGLLGLLLIPLGVLQSVAIGGAIVVAVTVLCSITILPAALALLGHRVESFAVRKRRIHTDLHSSPWHKLATFVMDHPGAVLVSVLSAVVLAATPALHARLDVPNLDVLPRGVESRVAQRDIEQRFRVKMAAPLMVELHSSDAQAQATYLAELRRVPNVDQVRERVVSGDRTLYTVTMQDDRLGGAAARATVDRIRAVHAPAKVELGGQVAWEREFFTVMRTYYPRSLLVVFASTFFVLLVAFRSLLLPIKAIVLDALSIMATLGIVVLVFQMGHGIGLLGARPLGWVEASMPLILFCILFGLSMDYEVFMLARVAEAWEDGATTAEATAEGLAHTAPLVTGAALIMIVIGMSFALTKLVLVKQIGFGIAIALALDATIVRGLLVPATMRLLGDLNWWMPPALARRMPRIRWGV